MNVTMSQNDWGKPMTLNDIKKAAKSIPPAPPDKVRVGKDLFAKLKRDYPQDLKDRNIYGSLFGIKIFLDETLKPNSYRIIKNKK